MKCMYRTNYIVRQFIWYMRACRTRIFEVAVQDVPRPDTPTPPIRYRTLTVAYPKYRLLPVAVYRYQSNPAIEASQLRGVLAHALYGHLTCGSDTGSTMDRCYAAGSSRLPPLNKDSSVASKLKIPGEASVDAYLAGNDGRFVRSPTLHSSWLVGDRLVPAWAQQVDMFKL